MLLSQPLSGRFQKHQLILRLLLRFRQLTLSLREVLVQLLAVVVNLQHPRDVGQGKTHVLQRGDPRGRVQLFLTVIAVPGKCIDLGRLQQPDIIVMTEHSDAHSG